MKTAALEPDGQGVHIGRYLLHRQIARGGMATIHIARLVGDEGFSRIVAAKRLLPEFAEDADFVTMFLDEARVASKIHHSNVVPVLDVVAADDNVILIQEYVHGAALDKLLRLSRQMHEHVPIRIAIAIATNVAAGLQAAHDTSDEVGMPLDIVHRDVSPQNIMVAVDGSARLLDFGVAKATMAAHITREHTFKGKIAYSAAEALHGASTPQSDVYSLAVVLWETIVGRRMFQGAASESEIVAKIMTGKIPSIAESLAAEREQLPPGRWAQLMALEPVLRGGLALRLTDRWTTARAFADALAATIAPAPMSEVAQWVRALGKELIEKNDRLLAEEEASWRRTPVPLGRELRTLSEQRGITMLSEADMEVEISQEAAQPRSIVAQLAGWRRPLLGGLAALVALVLALVVFRGGSTAAPVAVPVEGPATARPAVPVAPVAPPAATAAASAPVAAPKPAPEPIRAPTAQLAIDPTAIEVQAAPEVHEPAPIAKRTAVVERRRERSAPSAAKASVKAATKPAAEPVAVAPAAAPPAAPDCSPPYYFEGSKKIFKPNCLGEAQ